MEKSTNPETSLKTASSLLLLKAAFLLITPLTIVAMDWHGIDAVGRAISGALIVVGLYVLTAAILLRKRRRLGRILAWIVLPVFALGVPVGTILAVATMYKLEEGKTALR